MFLLSRPNMSWPKMKTKVPYAINQFRSPTVPIKMENDLSPVRGPYFK